MYKPTKPRIHITLAVAAICVCSAIVSTVHGQEPSNETFAEVLSKADSGDANAQFEAGLAYESGDAVVGDSERSRHYYRLAAEQGHVLAQNSLGSIFLEIGKYDKAQSWYKKAAEHGDYMAINSLGYMYDEGLGVEQDDERALSLYLRAANIGNPDSMWNIATLYNSGELGTIDKHLTCVWALRTLTYVARSKLLRSESIANVTEEMENAMTKDEFLKCEADANSWAPSE